MRSSLIFLSCFSILHRKSLEYISMPQRRIIILAIIVLFIGLAGFFVLRPSSMPTKQTAAGAAATIASGASNEARCVQYFAANLDEARRVTAGCRDGALRGDECANAERAIIEADSRDRFKRFTDR
jgi:hypothetical protein